MPLFKYIAKSMDGKVAVGRFDAPNKNALSDVLHNNNLLIMDIAEIKENSLFLFSMRKKIKSKELALFCRQFHTLINAGIQILECLFILKDQVGSRRLSKAIEKIYNNIKMGSSLSEAMSSEGKTFPKMLITIIEIGELSGDISSSLLRMAIYFEKENRVRQKIKKAMIYPIIILALALIIVTYLVIFIIPQFVDLFASFGEELPLPTRILISISNANPLIVLASLLSLVGLIMVFSRLLKIKHVRGLVNIFILKIPILGQFFRKNIAYKFTQALYELVNAGVPIVKSLEECLKVLGSNAFTEKFEKMIESVVIGSNIAGPLKETDIFPPMVIRMISIGEEAGALDTMLNKVSEYYEEEIDITIEKLLTMIEPLMIIFISGIVGFVLMSLFLPILRSYEVWGR